ncbi:MAG: Rrf2 family transcriptional regulator [Deltaproteobacteria bacterium]|nr:Rrf2 family transcriptional regulator [Deltaproteobacteria bacterium]
MRLTKAGEYAVRCILYLSSKKEGGIVGRRDIAREMDIPDQFLGKIAQQLSRAGLIEIIQGARGGYRLRVPPSKISLLWVVEAVIGEIFLNDCLMGSKSCFRSKTCSVNKVWEKARGQLRNTLRQATFNRLLKEESCLLPMINPKKE